MSTIGGRLLGVTLAALLTIGCGRGSTTAGMGTALAPVAGGVTVVVQNQNFADVDVFVVRDGDVVTRLGMVNGESTARFPIDPSLFPTGSLSLVARAGFPHTRWSTKSTRRRPLRASYAVRL